MEEKLKKHDEINVSQLLQKAIKQEARLYEDIKSNKLGYSVRMEQERISYGLILETLKKTIRE